jgi:SAM-dependent methyltransferase
MTSVPEVTKRNTGGLYAPIVFTLTIFTSALLLFFVQPLFTRLVLPQIGGAAAVWTTAMLFFQTVLIGGYLYAHFLTRYLDVRLQVIIHLVLLALAVFFLPLAVPESWSFDPNRPVVTQTLWLYALGVGLPFAVLSANAPLIQSWYRRSGGPHASDPYFLYSASNLGSLVALLAFPLAAEPLFGITKISQAWSVGFVALGVLLLVSGLSARGPLAVEQNASDAPANGPGLRKLALWAFLAFIPSSLMLSVTSKISMDIGSFPLIWVLPLSLYILTFVLVFSSRSPLTTARLRLTLPFALAFLTYLNIIPSNTLASFVLLILSFWCISLLAHRLLFDARPDAHHLTLFYVTMSVGGALGGIFNSIVAPLAFDRLIELPITAALVALLLIDRKSDRLPRDIAIGLAVATFVFLPFAIPIPAITDASVFLKGGIATFILLAAILGLRHHKVAAATAVVLTFVGWTSLGREPSVLEDRSFFGPHIIRDEDGLRRYSNGTTIHGAQLLADFEGRPRPLTYYHRNGPMAEILTSDKGKSSKTIGVVGLGVGSLACYGEQGQDWHFYEIDKKVVEIALDPKLFTFMSECGKDAEIYLGDARIVMQGQTDLRYDILVIDAYSSDAVPVHLATREALELYRDRLAPGGLLVFHISNRFYDLSRPLAAAAAAAGLESREKIHRADKALVKEGDTDSHVIVMSVGLEAMGGITSDPTWKALPPTDHAPWSDDHADLLSAIR